MSIQGIKSPPPVLTREDCLALLKTFCPYNRVGARARAMLCAYYRALLSPDEVMALFPKHFEPKTNTFRIAGRNPRVAAIDDRGCGEIVGWMCLRKKSLYDLRGRITLPPDDEIPLFCTDSGKPVENLGWLKSAGKRAGINRPVNPSLLKYTGVSEMIEEGIDLVTIKNQLGKDCRLLHSFGQKSNIDRIRQRTW